MKKEEIVTLIISQKENLLAALNADIAVHQDALDLDEQDTLDPEDYSMQDEQSDLKLVATQHRDNLEQEIKELKGLKLAAHSNVAFGSLVGTDKGLFFVGSSFKREDKIGNVFGVGHGSPIYNQLIGKKIGDTFEITGEQAKIKTIE